MLKPDSAEKTVYTLDGQDLKNMLVFAVERFARSEAEINALNVFPVPDGDTGSNMLLTMRSSLEDAQKVDASSVTEIMKMVARGSLLGARGNSGVILSQIWKGMSVSFQNKSVVDGTDLADAFNHAAIAAYEGLSNPVEGTMLTVIKEMAAAAVDSLGHNGGSITEVLKTAVEAAKRAVAATPELLPVLKEAGVVDSGGQGLYILFEGALMYLNGQTGELECEKSSGALDSGTCTLDVKFINTPDQQEILSAPSLNIGVVAVAVGEGITSIFSRLGASFIVHGGPSMNPSTRQIWQAVEDVSANKIIILPNDKNLILAARKVETLTQKEVLVIPTTTIPQGIAALLAFDPDTDLKNNYELMMESSSLVKTIEVTRATRDTRLNGLNIRKGQFIGLLDGKLLSVSEETGEAVVGVLDRIDLAKAENASIYFGSDTSQAEAENIRELIYRKNTRLNTEIIFGGQPLYDFIISIE